MVRVSDRNLSPRNGHTLMAGLGARISGCKNQKEESLEDQTDHNREVVVDLYIGPVEYLIIATKGKGERLDRPELAQIEAEFRKAKLDIFVWEDLGRLVRGVEAVRLLGIAVDHGTRVVVPNDNVDTANDTWEADAIKACADHVAHQEHTSRRLKHKLTNRFIKHGGSMARPIVGFVVPDTARSYGDWLKDPRFDLQSNPNADPWIYDGARLLRESLNCTAIADMFNARQIEVGPYCRRKEWDGAMVRRFYSNPLLKGQPYRNRKHSVKFHESGVRRSVINPKGPVYFSCPHLAYFDADTFDELNSLLDSRNARYRRKLIAGTDPRLRVPRKRTRFPGQHGRCWYCGYHHVWGGNGMTENLMCSNARNWQCWNSVGYDGALAVERLAELIKEEFFCLDGFDDQYRDLVERAGSNDHSDVVRRWERLKRDELELTKRRARFVEAIDKFGVQEMFEAKLKEIEADERKTRLERRALERLGQERLNVPESTVILRQMLEDEFAGAAYDSPEFGDLLRKLCPDFFVYLVRLCDGGHCLPRARVRLTLDGIIPDASLVPGLDGLLCREATLNLFDIPQRERIRLDAVKWAATGLGPKAIAAKIAETTAERPTATAVHNALALHERMISMGLSSPLVTVLAPPDDYPKLRRHKNPKYRFRSLDGYIPPNL
jgi:site-specific DNA recombinase